MDPKQCFGMRHLQISMTAPERLDAVLRPLAPRQNPLRATAVDGVIHVQGDGIDDTLFLFREARQVECGNIRFVGRYGAVLRRPGKVTLVLLDGTSVSYGKDRLDKVGERDIEG